MSRYIDADAIKDKAWKAESEACFYAFEDVVSVTDIDEAPSIDIVRCAECKYYEAKEDWCYWRDEAITADDFCSYGERSDDGKDIQSTDE